STGCPERLSANDLGGRAKTGVRTTFVCVAPRRLYLRGRLVSGGQTRWNVRSPASRRRPLRQRRKDPRLSHTDYGRRLQLVVSRLSARPGPAGCARPLAVCLYVGQPRVLVEGLAESTEL